MPSAAVGEAVGRKERERIDANIRRRDFGRSATSAVKKVAALAALAAIAWGADSAWTAWQRYRTPACSWPVRVRGVATSQQAGLVRCYLQALALGDMTELTAVADNDPAIRFTKADLAYSADERAGLATATFTPSRVDTAYVLLTIAYANGVRENTGIINMIARGDPSAWRMTIGTATGSSGPPSANAR